MISIKPYSLADILTLKRRPVQIIPDDLYTEIGIYSFGKGIFHKQPRSGLEVGNKDLFLVKEEDLILQITFAWEGAVGLASSNEDGLYGSVRFPTFRIDKSMCFPRFLLNYFKTQEGRDQLAKISPGSAGRNRVLSLKRIPEIIVPLPTLDEQLRIVARIEGLAAKIEEARGLRRETVEEAENILKEAEFQIWPDNSLDNAVPLENVTTYLSRGRQSAQGDSTQYLIKTQHVQQGHYVKSHITLEPHIASKVLPDAIVQTEDILIACSAAGCLGRVARFMETNQVASTDTHVAIARANSQVILPKYLYLYLEGSQGQIQLRSRERGDWTREKVGFRLTELNLADLKRVPVPLPSLREQERIVNYLDGLQSKIDLLKHKQAETSAELDALLPSVLDRAFKGEL